LRFIEVVYKERVINLMKINQLVKSYFVKKDIILVYYGLL